VSIRPASLDAPISDDDSTEFGEIVGDEDAQRHLSCCATKLRNEVGGLLDVLDDREKKIIFQRFGLDGGNRKRLKKWARNSASPGNGFVSCKHRAIEVAPRAQQEGASGRRRVARWKLELGQCLWSRTRGLPVRAFFAFISLHAVGIESISSRPIRTSLTITMRVSRCSPLVFAQKTSQLLKSPCPDRRRSRCRPETSPNKAPVACKPPRSEWKARSVRAAA